MDVVLEHVVKKAAAADGVLRVRLFGSRARGDATERSDYDFFIETVDWDHARWSSWAADVSATLPTVHGLDLVWANEAQAELRKRALSEGKVVYER